ncbi:hypothetical protein AB0425_17645 [Actinosynnema sp. NPDC051121]
MTGSIRIISSVFEPDAIQSGELTKDQAEALSEAIQAQMRYAERESYCLDQIKQKTDHIALVPYEVDGERRWAVYTSDVNNGDCYLDSADRETANARYEEEVRQLAACADPGDAWWDSTDVDGVLDRSDVEADEADDQ